MTPDGSAAPTERQRRPASVHGDPTTPQEAQMLLVLTLFALLALASIVASYAIGGQDPIRPA